MAASFERGFKGGAPPSYHIPPMNGLCIYEPMVEESYFVSYIGANRYTSDISFHILRSASEAPPKAINLFADLPTKKNGRRGNEVGTMARVSSE